MWSAKNVLTLLGLVVVAGATRYVADAIVTAIEAKRSEGAAK